MISDTIRTDFPILSADHGDKPFVYLDSAATSLKPKLVIEALDGYYQGYSANIHRGIYDLSEQATAAYEAARLEVARFINAYSPQEIIFTKGTTEGINLLATSLSRSERLSGLGVVTTSLEHHANFVPWQQLAHQEGMDFQVITVPEDGILTPELVTSAIHPQTKILAFTAVSNVLGTIQPVKAIVSAVKTQSPNCLIVVDAAQAMAHLSVDVKDWGADAIAFSGHKLFGPTGIGVLWARQELLERLSPYQYGGGMIRSVSINETTFDQVPEKFEAGTPPIAEAIGLKAAIQYLSEVGLTDVRAHEVDILTYALSELQKLPWITVYGSQDPNLRSGGVAFTVEGVHAHDVAQVLADQGVCVRAGHHCAMPLHTQLGIAASVRASIAIYSTRADIDALVHGLQTVKNLFS